MSFGQCGPGSHARALRNDPDREPPAGNDHPSSFLNAVEAELEEVPFFLRNALPLLLGTSTVSVRDLFWAGLTSDLLHPYLKGAVFLAVDGRRTIPVSSLSAPAWAQPLYVLEFREARDSAPRAGSKTARSLSTVAPRP